MHLHQTAYALALTFTDVIDRFTGVQLARVNPDKAELPDEWIGHDLEHQSREWSRIRRRTFDFHSRIINADALDRRHIERRREVSSNGVEEILHALVLE